MRCSKLYGLEYGNSLSVFSSDYNIKSKTYLGSSDEAIALNCLYRFFSNFERFCLWNLIGVTMFFHNLYTI